MKNEIIINAENEAKKIIDNAKKEANKLILESSLLEEVKKHAKYIKENTLKECRFIREENLENSCFMKYSFTYHIEKNLYQVKSKETYKIALFNSLGEQLTDFKYDLIEKADHLPNGMYLVGIEKNNQDYWGIIDENGFTIIPTEYQNMIAFYENLAAVKKNDKFGYINIKNETVIPFIYNKAYGFFNGKAKVVLNNEEFFINKMGNKIIS